MSRETADIRDGDQDVRPVVLNDCCVHLRHKMMYCDARQMTPGRVDDSSDTRVFYCVKTMQALGPDGETVSPKECASGNRACFRARGASGAR